MRADRCDIYTDVDGVYTSDPRVVAKARRLDRVAYEEMLEMASLGAKVLQVRSVELAMVHRVPTTVRSSFDPPDAARPGTLICDEDVNQNERIGRHGLALIQEIADRKRARGADGTVRLLTHCNAGWLATVDWGTALAPIYMAHDAGLDVHVWVDETRPRNQGAALTAWELGSHGVGHTLVSDNAGGHLMQRGDVDMVIVGTDRVTRQGDVANKIGTYLKALAARDNDVPFWVALPSSTIDWTVNDGLSEIPIEERAADEVLRVTGRGADGAMHDVQVTPDGTPAANPAFDVTPARLVTGLITERGRCDASAAGLAARVPDQAEMQDDDATSRFTVRGMLLRKPPARRLRRHTGEPDPPGGAGIHAGGAVSHVAGTGGARRTRAGLRHPLLRLVQSPGRDRDRAAGMAPVRAARGRR